MKLQLGAAAMAAALLPLTAHAAQYVTVISSTPVTAPVNVPRRVCADEPRLVQPQPSGAGAVFGAIAGGVLGNAVGSGFNRAAATGIGAVAGAAISNSVEAGAHPPAEVTVRECRTVSGVEPRTVGYDVVYEFAGQRYSTRLAHDPGPQLAIDVRPSGAPEPGAYPAPQTYPGAPGAGAAAGEAPRYEVPPPAYDVPRPAYGAPVPIYYPPAPVYYGPPGVVVQPSIGIGFGYWGHGRHWH